MYKNTEKKILIYFHNACEFEAIYALINVNCIQNSSSSQEK